MLELKNITKIYPAGGEDVEALKGIDLCFRDNEFVSILGPSGCGKTTMLNIIGGLDQYTSGDLVINGVSTKKYKDRDWDTYRNHTIGFVFQSYHLIPHQSVLQNVELALTLSGVGKAERRKRAKEALERVGLGSQLRKKPSEMSGGQMQRVAIARAIVNNPDIILADEPTGALDSETSVQVMGILKEIAKDKLVIMVTHNPELAEKYSTRIVRMLDGRIVSDDMPFSKEERHAPAKNIKKKDVKQKKPSMSFATSFGLSLKNLFTKKGRTALTSFAGSIGIIGIALILAVSQGMTGYINSVQEETLSSYPITLEASSVDMTTLMQTFMSRASSEADHEMDAAYSKGMVFDMVKALNNLDSYENDLSAFKRYIEDARETDTGENALHDAISGIQYTYDCDLLVYTQDENGSIYRSDTEELMNRLIMEYMGTDMSSFLQMRERAGMGDQAPLAFMVSGGGFSVNLWQEMLSGDNGSLVNPILEKQYDVIYGTWPTAADEVVLVLDENNELSDITLYALGLIGEDEIGDIMEAAVAGEELGLDGRRWSYEDLCNMKFRVILNSDCYARSEDTGLYTDLRDTDAGLRYLYDNAMQLRISGIIRPKADVTSPILSGSIGYTCKLTEYVIEHSHDSAVVEAQLSDPSTDIFSGLPFNEMTGKLSDAEKEKEFRTYIASLDEDRKADVYIKIMSIPTKEQMADTVERTLSSMTRTDMESALIDVLQTNAGMGEADSRAYAESMQDEELTDLFRQMLEQKFREEFAQQVAAQMSGRSVTELSAALDMAADRYTTEECAVYYDEVLEFSESSYDKNLSSLGYVDIDKPASINMYASTFDNKEVIEDAISTYNESVDELKQIRYTDYIGLMMSSVTTIIHAITYVLIAFVAISLVVSSIMIGVITLISVQERTKEIGILRAIGASKRNVSSMFNAETLIIGFTSGVLGVCITYLLCIPVNAILHKATGINTLSAFLPPQAAVILVGISMLLTLIAGIIPSRSAAKKDPVVALRTE